MQKKVANYMNYTSQCINDSRNYIGMLHHYEELNLATYVEGDETKMVFGNTQNATTNAEAVKTSVNSLVENLKNPYFNIYHWVKGEIFDIEAVYNALATREFILERVGKREKKKKNTEESLDNVKAGRMTVKTLFKGSGDVGSMTVKIENVSNFSIIDFLYRLRKKSRCFQYWLTSLEFTLESPSSLFSRREE
jgi:hypothetical protein